MNLENSTIWKIKNLETYTYVGGNIAVTGTDGSATAKITPNWTIIVEATKLNNAATITLATPFSFKVLGMKVINTTDGDKVQGAMTCQLKNNTSAVTDILNQGYVDDTYSREAAYIDDAYDTFEAGDDDLVLTFAADESSSTSTNSCRVIIYIEPAQN